MRLRNLRLYAYLSQKMLLYDFGDHQPVEGRVWEVTYLILKESLQVFQAQSLLFSIIFFPLFQSLALPHKSLVLLPNVEGFVSVKILYENPYQKFW